MSVMRRSHAVLMLIGVLTAGAAWAQAPTVLPALDSAEWDAYGYSLGETDSTKSFVLRVSATARTTDANCRIALNVHDEANYNIVELSPSGTRVLRVENGVEVALGKGSAVGLVVGRSSDVLIKRDGDRVEALVDGVPAARAVDGVLSGGKTALGSLGGSVTFGEPLEQPTSPVYFDDNFMRAEGEESEWEELLGEWVFQAVENALRSSNGFNYRALPSEEPSVSVVGDWFWDDYEARVACEPHGEGEIGLIAYHEGPGSYYLLKWTSEPEADEAQASGALQLVRFSDGGTTILAQADGGYIPGRWYELGLSVAEGLVEVFVDGARVATAWDSGLSGGRVGLYASGAEGATFDDLSVRQVRSRPVTLADLADWRSIGGKWQSQPLGPGPDGQRCRARADGEGKLLVRSGPPQNATFRASIRVRAAEAGLIGGYLDESNYYLLALDSGDGLLQLTRVADGARQVLAQTEAPEDEVLELALSLNEGHITAEANGSVRMDAWDAEMSGGQMGLFLRDGQVDFTTVSLERGEALPSIVTYPGAFAQEVSMANWAEESSDWTPMPAEGQEATDPSVIRWHRAHVPGDKDVEMDLLEPPTASISLVSAAEETTPNSGYSLAVAPGENGTAVLSRDGAAVATKAMPGLTPESMESLRLSTRGSIVTAYVNERMVAAFTDPAPLAGSRVGWSGPAATIEGEDVRVSSANVVCDTFRKAPVDWLPASGEWKVTNRWDCDPRWSFFSGASDDIACLWHKSTFGENIALEFCGAVQYDASRGPQGYYGWARDINCTIAADGKDVSSGYSLIFGGWDDQYTRLLRGNEVVAETTAHLIPRASSIHRQWFYLQIVKEGPRIRCWLDGTLLFDYTDPEPLAGRHVALWTYEDGIAVARVRISSDQCEPPGYPPVRPTIPRCCYDEEAEDEQVDDPSE